MVASSTSGNMIPKDKSYKASERASETRGQTLHRQEQNRMHMASMRDSERSVLKSLFVLFLVSQQTVLLPTYMM